MKRSFDIHARATLGQALFAPPDQSALLAIASPQDRQNEIAGRCRFFALRTSEISGPVQLRQEYHAMTLEDEVVQGRPFARRSIGNIRAFIRRELAEAPGIQPPQEEAALSVEDPPAPGDQMQLDPLALTPESMSSLVGRVGYASVEEIETLLEYLRNARAYLDGESARLTQEITRFSEANENSLKAVALIQETVDRWHRHTIDLDTKAQSAETLSGQADE